LETLAAYQDTCTTYTPSEMIDHPQLMETCIALMCNADFLDGLDECIACQVTTGETSESEATTIAIAYSNQRQSCIAEGYNVGQTSTADSANTNGAGSVGSTTSGGGSTVDDEIADRER
jgi:hypothetical protein